MEQSTLDSLLASPNKLIEAIKSERDTSYIVDGKVYNRHDLALKQYDPKQHSIKDRTKRPDRWANLPNGQLDNDGNPVLVQTLMPTTRMSIPIQRYIIKQRASFAVGNSIELKPTVQPSRVFDAVQGQWRKNKIHFHLKEVARRLMAETEVAVIFFTNQKPEKPEALRFRLKMVSPSTGDELYPVFDSMEDMIAFGRGYKVGKEERFDLYTSEYIRHFVTRDGKTIENPPTKLPYGKIPVVYWSQPEPECDDVQDIIEARERIQSDFFDTNLRIGDPILFLKGEAMNLPAAGAPGKVLEGKGDGADAKFLSPADATQARELEFNMLDDLIFSLTRTVKLTPENLKGLGIESGAAMDRILIASHMAAKDMQDGEFGMGIQRMLNFLTHVYADVLSVNDGLEIEPVFSLFRIDDASERVDLALKANGGLPIMSHKSSIQQAGFTDDAESELNDILGQDEDDETAGAIATGGANPKLPTLGNQQQIPAA